MCVMYVSVSWGVGFIVRSVNNSTSPHLAIQSMHACISIEDPEAKIAQVLRNGGLAHTTRPR